MNRFRDPILALSGLVFLGATVATLGVRSARAGTPLPSTPVRYVEAGARDPFHDVNARVLNAGDSQIDFQYRTVPAGKRLVIEFVSVNAMLPPNQRPDVTLNVIQGNRLVLHHVAFTQTNLVDKVDMIGCHTVTLYADPGTTPFASVRRDGGTSGQANFRVAISGHFVTL